MKPPVKYRPRHAHGEGRLGVGRVDAERRILEMIHGLHHAEEHEAHAHRRRENHGEPARVGVIRPRVRAAETHPGQRRDYQRQAEKQYEVGGDHEQPVEPRDDPPVHVPEDLGRFFLKNGSQNDERDYKEGGYREHPGVQVEAQDSYVVEPAAEAAPPVRASRTRRVLFLLHSENLTEFENPDQRTKRDRAPARPDISALPPSAPSRC